MKIKLLTFAAVLVWLGLVSASAQNQPFPVPDSFVGKEEAPAPPNLPAKFQIPTFTRIDVAAQRKVPRTPPPADDGYRQRLESRRLLWRPDLKSAEILRDAKNVAVIFQWEGNTTSNAYQIDGFTFWEPSLKYPNYIMPVTAPTALDYGVNQGLCPGSPGDFPGLGWYTPGFYTGQADLAGTKVLVFEAEVSYDPRVPASSVPNGAQSHVPESAKAKIPVVKKKLYVDAKKLRPLLLDSGDMLYLFTYTDDPAAHVVPDGIYAKAITQYFHQRNIPMQ